MADDNPDMTAPQLQTLLEWHIDNPGKHPGRVIIKGILPVHYTLDVDRAIFDQNPHMLTEAKRRAAKKITSMGLQLFAGLEVDHLKKINRLIHILRKAGLGDSSRIHLVDLSRSLAPEDGQKILDLLEHISHYSYELQHEAANL